MDLMRQEIAAFRHRKTAETLQARQRVALRLSCGLDLPENIDVDPDTTKATLARIQRAMQRERMKALRQHWSYDLDRHIALKLAYDDMRRSLGLDVPKICREGRNDNGARRRRPSSRFSND